MAKIYISESDLQNKVIVPLNSGMNNLSTAINEYLLLDIPSDFSGASKLSEIYGCMLDSKEKIDDITSWIKLSINSYKSRCQVMDLQIKTINNTNVLIRNEYIK